MLGAQSFCVRGVVVLLRGCSNFSLPSAYVPQGYPLPSGQALPIRTCPIIRKWVWVWQLPLPWRCHCHHRGWEWMRVLMHTRLAFMRYGDTCYPQELIWTFVGVVSLKLKSTCTHFALGSNIESHLDQACAWIDPHHEREGGEHSSSQNILAYSPITPITTEASHAYRCLRQSLPICHCVPVLTLRSCEGRWVVLWFKGNVSMFDTIWEFVWGLLGQDAVFTMFVLLIMPWIS